jgi:hypothetical protein
MIIKLFGFLNRELLLERSRDFLKDSNLHLSIIMITKLLRTIVSFSRMIDTSILGFSSLIKSVKFYLTWFEKWWFLFRADES